MRELPEMTDVVFSLSGKDLPADYAVSLWREVARIVPALEGIDTAGILPVRAPEHGSDLRLPRRARLVLRTPVALLGEVRCLSSKMLDVAGHALALGEAKERPLQPSPTLHAQLVASEAEEEEFLAGQRGEDCGIQPGRARAEAAGRAALARQRPGRGAPLWLRHVHSLQGDRQSGWAGGLKEFSLTKTY